MALGQAGLFLNELYLLVERCHFVAASHCSYHSYRIAFSRSTAHNAAPTELLNENTIETKGIISRTNDAMPKLHY